MPTSTFLDHHRPPERPARPNRRDFARFMALFLLSAGAGLALAAALQEPGVTLPEPGPRRYGPAYRHRRLP